MIRRLAVVGASLAGLRTAEALRARGFDGELLVIGDETRPPYNRPPLSKQFLTTDMAEAAVALPAREDVDVRWLLGRRATRLDLAGRRVETDRGTVGGLDAVVIATGAHARTLDLPHLDGIHTLRGLPDALALRASLRRTARRGGRVAVLGAGLVGCEVAASCRTLGVAVSLIDPAPVPMARALPRAVALRVADLHRGAGVDLRLSTAVTAVHGDDHGRVARITLDRGGELEIDTLVVAVGSRPGTGWLHGSGLDVADGVRTGSDGRAIGGGGHVVAVGDVSRTPSRPGGPAVRGEHWSRAVEQAGRAAHALLGGPPLPAAPEFFWSDQYGHRLQVLGDPHTADTASTEHDGDRWVTSYRSGGALAAVVALDLPARIAAARRELGRVAA